MSFKKGFMFFGVFLVLGVCWIQAPPVEGEKLSISKKGVARGHHETVAERLARVRREAMETGRKLVQSRRAGVKGSSLSRKPSNDLSEPLLVGEPSDSSVSDDVRKADELKFDAGAARAREFHAIQESDARLTSEYLQKQLDLENLEQFERDDLVGNFNKDKAGIAAGDLEVSGLSPEDRAELEATMKEIMKDVTPEEQEAINNMSPEQHQELEAFIADVLLPRNVDNAPYGNDDELSHAQIEAAKKARLAKEREEIKKFIEQVVAEPRMTDEEFQAVLHKDDNFRQSGRGSEASSVDEGDDSPIFTEVPDDGDTEFTDNDSIDFREESDGESDDSLDTVAHTVEAVVNHETDVIDHLTQEAEKVEQVLKDPSATHDEKVEAEGRAEALAAIADSGEKLLTHVESAHPEEVKSSSWYEKVVTQKNMLKALSIGLKAASFGIVGYGIYKGLSSGSAVSDDASAATVAIAPVTAALARASRGGSLEGLTLTPPTHGGFFKEHRAIPTDYHSMVTSMLGGRK